MRKLVIFIFVSLCLSQLLYGEMYDPFRKTAKHKVVSLIPSATLLPPPPLMAMTVPPPAMIPLPPPPPPTLVTAIMNEKAFINGAWYRVGDRFNNHEVTYIQNNFVGLKQNNRLTMIAVGESRHVLSTKEVP